MLDYQAVARLLAAHPNVFSRPVQEFALRGQWLAFNTRPLLMGVINLSADSFYRESICSSTEAALARGLLLQRQGAGLVDVGAESTLPQARRVPAEEQEALLLPVVQGLAAAGVLVSVESYYLRVLQACARAGAAVFNLTGLREEQEVLRLAARYGLGVIHCYIQGGDTVRNVQDFAFYADTVEAMQAFFAERLEWARKAGVTRNILDPGLGFYYRNLADGRLRVHHQLETFLHTARLHQLGWPVLNILPHAPAAFGRRYRREAEPFFAVLALLGRSHIIRTHELARVERIRKALALYGG